MDIWDWIFYVQLACMGGIALLLPLWVQSYRRWMRWEIEQAVKKVSSR